MAGKRHQPAMPVVDLRRARGRRRRVAPRADLPCEGARRVRWRPRLAGRIAGQRTGGV